MSTAGPSPRHGSAALVGNALVMLRQGEKDGARALLAPLAFNPHNPGMANQAAKLIAEIDAGKAAQAERELEGSTSDRPAAATPPAP